MDGEKPKNGRILEEASNVVRRGKEATGNVEQAKSYKRGQIKELTLPLYSDSLSYKQSILCSIKYGLFVG